MLFPGQGRKVILTRKFAGRELKREVVTDAIVGARILEISDVQETDPKDASTPVQKYITVRVSGGARGGKNGTSVKAFENDGALHLFDACKPGDLVDISAVSMRGSRNDFNSYKAYYVEPSEANQPTPQVV